MASVLLALAAAVGAAQNASVAVDARVMRLGETRLIRLRERQWWHGKLDLSAMDDDEQPLAVSVRVVRADHCSEGTSADGSCRFGLKVFGSARGHKHALREAFDNEELMAGSARVWQMDGSYAAIASACELKAALNGTFYLSVYGWDGTNDVSIVAHTVTSIC